MKIILAHDHFDAGHLANVINQMSTLGAPTIKAVWIEAHGAWVALEGCHRVRAAKMLGLTPCIDPIEYSDNTIASAVPGSTDDESVTIAERCDSAWRNKTIEFVSNGVAH